MKPVKKGRYILNAKWHKRHGEEVEVVMVRKGITEAHYGKTVYHVAFDPNEEFRSEDLDEEFVEENFEPLEEMLCGFDISLVSDEDFPIVKKDYAKMKRELKRRINVRFVERRAGDPQFEEADLLCVFVLDVKDGKPSVSVKLKDENSNFINIFRHRYEGVR